MQKGNSWRQFMVVLLSIGFVFGHSEFSQGLSKEDSASEHRPIIKKMSSLQIPFIANKGQVDKAISYKRVLKSVLRKRDNLSPAG